MDNSTNELKFAILSREEDRKFLEDIRLKMGEGIAGTVWRQGKPLVIKDVSRDNRFSAKADTKTEYKTSSLMAVPLVVDGKIIGVMEAINKKKGAFNKFDLEIFQNLSLQAAVAIENAELYELAITDGLTHLYIHRYFQQRLDEEMNRSLRYDCDLSVVMIDIDYFKKLNDTYGHQAGDEVLIRTSELIRSNSRSCDIPCRYGGEEFCVILPETDIEGAVLFAEKIREIIELLEVEYKDRMITLTISVGVASRKTTCTESKGELIRMADEALYKAKEAGRNCVKTFSKINN